MSLDKETEFDLLLGESYYRQRAREAWFEHLLIILEQFAADPDPTWFSFWLRNDPETVSAEIAEQVEGLLSSQRAQILQ